MNFASELILRPKGDGAARVVRVPLRVTENEVLNICARTEVDACVASASAESAADGHGLVSRDDASIEKV